MDSCFLPMRPFYLALYRGPVRPDLFIDIGGYPAMPCWASRDIDCQVTALNFRFQVPFSPYSVFPRQDTGIYLETMVHREHQSAPHFCHLAPFGTKICDSQGGVKKLDDEYFW